jgi:integrase
MLYSLSKIFVDGEELNMSVRKRTWETPTGEVREAWVVDYKQLRKRHLKTFTRKRDADAYHAKVAVDIKAGIHTRDSLSITVSEAGLRWLESREAAGVERTTLTTYREHLDLHIAPLIGSYRLATLTVPFVRDFEDRLRQEDRSSAMVRKVLVSLSGILADAMDRGLVAQNVVRNRRAHRNGSVEARQKHRLEAGRDIPTPDEIRVILGHLQGRARPMLLTAIFTGLRASELRGLRWADVDFARNELHVRQRADRFGMLGAPKSAGSRRTVPLLPMVVNALREWRLACPSEFVFPGDNGQPIGMTTVVYQWQAAQIAAGVVAGGRAKYTGLHALRHFYASWCINRKADGGLELPIKVVQSRLGHASIQMTADRYGHLFPRANDEAELAAAERAFLTTV